MISVHQNLPYLSSCDDRWMRDSAHASYYNKKNIRRIKVPTVTLDALIDEYGTPDFIKLDVEGYEETAIRGLSKPVKGLSFEFHQDWLHQADAVIEHLSGLGCYRYNYAANFTSKFVLDEWIKGPALMEHLRRVLSERGPGSWGDAYAKLCGADCSGACDVAN